MAIAWTAINAKLDKFLGITSEAGGAELQSDVLRVEAWNWAQDVFVHHTPMCKIETLEVEDDGRTGILPTDLYAVDRIYDANEERWWWPVTHRPGNVMYSDPDTLQFWTWGNRLYLDSDVDVDSSGLTLYYWAYYPKIAYDLDSDGGVSLTDETIYTPRWAELALCHLTAASVLQPMEIFASDINQYKIMIDSGNPEHNPRAQSADYHLRWYNTLVGLVPVAGVRKYAQ